MAGIPINNLSSTIQRWLQAGGDIENLLKQWNNLDLDTIVQKIKIGNNTLEADNQHILDLTNFIPKGYEGNTDTLTIAKVMSDQIENTGTISSDSLNLKKSLIFHNQTIDLTSLQKLLDTKPWENVELKTLSENEEFTNLWMKGSGEPYGHYNASFGSSNITGSMAFNIIEVYEDINTFALDAQSGALDVGDEYSCFVRLNLYDKDNPTKLLDSITRQRMNLGKITKITTEGKYVFVEVDNFPHKSILNINNYVVENADGTETEYTKDDYVFVGYNHENDTMQDNSIEYEANTFRIIAKPHLGTRRIGWTAFTEGLLNRALVKCASSRGYGNTSYGSYSDTSGWNNKAGYCATATGKDNESTGETTFTANRGNKAKANNSTAFGSGNIVEALQGFVIGSNNKIDSGSINALLTGYSNIIKNCPNSAIFGQSNINISDSGDTFVSGRENIVNAASQSFTAGKSNTNNSNQGSVLGLRNNIKGTAAFAANLRNSVNGEGATAFGADNISQGKYQFVRGMFNKADTVGSDKFGKYLDIVGNGTDKDHRSNAYTLSKEGVGWFAGGLKIGGTQESEGKDILIELKVVGDEIDKVYTYGSDMPYICYYTANGYTHSPFEECIILTHEIKTSENEYNYNQIAISISSGEIKKRSGTSGTKGLGHEDEDWSLVQGGGGTAEVNIATPDTAGIVKPINNISVNEKGEIDIGYAKWQDDDIDTLTTELGVIRSPMLVSYNNLNGYEHVPFNNCAILTIPADVLQYVDDGDGGSEEYEWMRSIQIAFDGINIKFRAVGVDTAAPQGADWYSLVTQKEFDNFTQGDWVDWGTLQNSIDEIYQEILGNGYMYYYENILSGDILVLENGLNARLGNYSDLTTLTLQMPEDVDFTSRYTMYNSSFTLHCGDIPPTLIYAGAPIRWAGDDVSYDGIFTPQANTIYEVWVTFVDIDKEGNPIISARVGIV